MKIFFSIILLLFLTPFAMGGNENEFFTATSLFLKDLYEFKTMIIQTLVLVSVLFVVVVNEIARTANRRKLIIDQEWEAFYWKAKQFDLESDEIDFLERLLNISDVKNPDVIFVSASFYEKVLDDFLVVKWKLLGESFYKRLHRIRHKLGYDNIPIDIPYSSSRQFIEKEKVFVEDKEGRTFSSQVVEVFEEHWSIENKTQNNYVAGDEFTFKLLRLGDGEYALKPEMFSQNGDRLCFKHTRKLLRKQLRQFVRIDVKFDVQAKIKELPENVELFEEEFEREYDSFSADLSAGGLSFCLDHKLPKGTIVLLNFKLDKENFDKIIGKIVRIGENKKEKLNFVHSVAFLEIESVDQEKILQFIHKRQIEEIQWR